MRDWLKNVLVTLYERDEDNNLLTEKQKLRVRKCMFKGMHECVYISALMKKPFSILFYFIKRLESTKL